MLLEVVEAQAKRRTHDPQHNSSIPKTKLSSTTFYQTQLDLYHTCARLDNGSFFLPHETKTLVLYLLLRLHAFSSPFPLAYFLFWVAKVQQLVLLMYYALCLLADCVRHFASSDGRTGYCCDCAFAMDEFPVNLRKRLFVVLLTWF